MIVDYCLAIGQFNAIVRGPQDVVSVLLWRPSIKEISHHYFIKLLCGPAIKSLDVGRATAVVRVRGAVIIKLRFTLRFGPAAVRANTAIEAVIAANVVPTATAAADAEEKGKDCNT